MFRIEKSCSKQNLIFSIFVGYLKIKICLYILFSRFCVSTFIPGTDPKIKNVCSCQGNILFISASIFVDFTFTRPWKNMHANLDGAFNSC